MSSSCGPIIGALAAAADLRYAHIICSRPPLIRGVDSRLGRWHDQEIKAELNALIESQGDLLALTKSNEDILAFGTKYQHWYSSAYKIVEALAPERLPEFVSYYLI